MILHDFVKGMIIELKILFKEFGNESLKDIFKRFRDRLHTIWKNLKVKYKDILVGSIEAGIVAFFSNLIVFLIKKIFTMKQQRCLGESVGDTIALSITAAAGAVLSTIAIYYMDKFRNGDKVGKLHMQLATQSGVCVQYKTAQSYFVLYDAHCFVAQEYKRTMQSLQDEKVKYEQRQKVLNEELDGLERLTKQAKELICGIKGE